MIRFSKIVYPYNYIKRISSGLYILIFFSDADFIRFKISFIQGEKKY
jgi:hypothetical protein